MSNKKKKVEYFEIADAKISDNKRIVISDCSNGGFTIAQRLDVTENNHTNKMYLKGAFHINNINGLYELRDALNYVIGIVEDRDEDSSWDE